MTAEPPRPIKGSVGNRVRVILGSTGSEWLLLTNNDDGDRQWQSHSWSGIPNAVAKQLNNCSDKGRYAKLVDFGPSGAWFINGVKQNGTADHSWWGGTLATTQIKEKVTQAEDLKVSFGTDLYGSETYCLIQGRNGYWCSHNIDNGLSDRLSRMNKKNRRINEVRLFHGGKYFISDEEGSEWVVAAGDHLSKELKKRGKTEDLALAEDGSWIVIRPDSYSASTGVDDTLTDLLGRFYRDQRNRNNTRARQIREHHERVAREARMERERAEALARAAREEEEAAATAAEAERAAKEAAERAERESAERAARVNERVEALESKLEERLLEESKSLKELEAHLQNRKRSLHASIQELPPEKRTRFQDVAVGGGSQTQCVVCHDLQAVRAVVPCGHLCLCDDCANAVASTSNSTCPLCRGQLHSTLKIFGSHSA